MPQRRQPELDHVEAKEEVRAETSGRHLFPHGPIGSLVTIVALAAMLSYFTSALRTHGWGGLTMMALPTATLFAALGAAMVSGVWRDALGFRPTRFSRNVLISAGLVQLHHQIAGHDNRGGSPDGRTQLLQQRGL